MQLVKIIMFQAIQTLIPTLDQKIKARWQNYQRAFYYFYSVLNYSFTSHFFWLCNAHNFYLLHIR